jgi:hypothetical protein
MGSTRFYEEHCRGISFGCAIVMDLIGHDVENTSSEWDEPRPDLGYLLVVLGADTDKALPGIVECAAGRVDRLQVVPAHSRYLQVDMSDYHAFKENSQPYLFLTCGMGRCYHKDCDSFSEPGWVNIDKVRRVHRFVLQLVACADEANGTDGTGLGTRSRPVDPVDFEARMIHAALGDRLPLARKGLERLRTRQDLDRFARILIPILLPQGQTDL